MTKNKLKEYANKLMFDMDDTEYDTLIEEFDIILKQMDLIGEIEDIEKVEPMTFPFEITSVLRNDIIDNSINTSEALKNANNILNNKVKVPKVVE